MGENKIKKKTRRGIIEKIRTKEGDDNKKLHGRRKNFKQKESIGKRKKIIIKKDEEEKGRRGKIKKENKKKKNKKKYGKKKEKEW